MSLKIIIGTENKTKYMYELVKACESENKHAYVFVPKSYKISAEKEYINSQGVSGMIGTKVTDINTFISNVLSEYNINSLKPLLPDMAKKMCVKKCIRENEDIFKLYKTVKDTSGFVDTIYNYILKIESENSFESINETNEDFSMFDDGILKEKLKEIYKIYKEYKSSIKDKFMTSNNEIEAFIELIEKNLLNSKLENMTIFVDNYNNFNTLELLLIKSLLRKNVDIVINIDLDIGKYENFKTNIFDISYETYANLVNISKELKINLKVINLNEKRVIKTNNNLEFLKENIFVHDSYVSNTSKDDTVKIIVLDNAYKEIEYIAKEIKQKVIYESKRYKDFVIYTNDILEYKNIIKNKFLKYDIPVYVDDKIDVLNSNIYRYIKSMLNLVVNPMYKDLGDVFNYLKSGISDVEQKDIYIFENYIKEFGIYAYGLNKPFTKNNKQESRDYIYDLDKLNNIRENIVKDIEEFKLAINSAKILKGKYFTKDIITNIVEFLNKKNIIVRYEEILENIKNTDEETYSKKVQVLKEIYNVFDMISLAYNEISKEEFSELLEYGASNINISTIPYMIDQVEVIDIGKLSGEKKDYIYIIGANDASFPKQAQQDNIFSDADIEELAKKDIVFKQKSEYTNIKELFNIYKTVKKCNKYLRITFPSSKTNGATLRPSYLLQDIKEMLNIKIEGNITTENEDKVNYLSNNISFEDFMDKIKNYDDLEKDEKYKLAVMYKYLVNNGYEKYIDYLRSDENLSKATLDKLYKDSLKLSVSKLERFERCPFAYFTEYDLKILKNKEYELSKMDIGTLMHKVLEMFTKFMIERNIDFKEAIKDEKIKAQIMIKLDEIINDIFENSYANYEDNKKNVFLKAKIKNNMKKIILAVLDSFSYSSFIPLGYEIEFEEGALYAPIKIELDNKTMYLIGKIDRVDTAKIDDKIYVRIVDYKSSDKNLSIDMIRDKISLQLMTYMSAIIENKEKISDKYQVLPAAINYLNITSKVLNLTEYTDEKVVKETVKKTLKLKGIYLNNIKVLKELDSNFEEPKDSYIDVSKRSMSNANKILTESDFAAECESIKQSLKEIGEDIVKGNVRIKPNKKIKDVCKYCEYRSICRKDIIC